MEGEQPYLGDLLTMVINHLLTGIIRWSSEYLGRWFMIQFDEWVGATLPQHHVKEISGCVPQPLGRRKGIISEQGIFFPPEGGGGENLLESQKKIRW